jgi:predicted nucleic acid-binding protein
VTLCSDPRDNKFLELALAGGAHWLVTGDRDLLEIGHFRGTTILTSREFLARG